MSRCQSLSNKVNCCLSPSNHSIPFSRRNYSKKSKSAVSTRIVTEFRLHHNYGVKVGFSVNWLEATISLWFHANGIFSTRRKIFFLRWVCNVTSYRFDKWNFWKKHARKNLNDCKLTTNCSNHTLYRVSRIYLQIMTSFHSQVWKFEEILSITEILSRVAKLVSDILKRRSGNRQEPVRGRSHRRLSPINQPVLVSR